MDNPSSILPRAAAIRRDAGAIASHPVNRERLFELASAAAALAEEACQPPLLVLHVPKFCVDHVREKATEAGITLSQAYALLATGTRALWICGLHDRITS